LTGSTIDDDAVRCVRVGPVLADHARDPDEGLVRRRVIDERDVSILACAQVPLRLRVLDAVPYGAPASSSSFQP
jgi:hypothetical protein